MATDSKSRAREALLAWKNDPVRFSRQVLGVDPWSRQRDVLQAVARYDRVAVRSGHKVSKSCSAAILALWWVTTRREGLVVLTSATARQVKRILWKELTSRHSHARLPIGGKLAVDPATGLSLPGDRWVYGFSTKEPERMAGVSGAELLFILDEASGIPDEIFEAIEGNRAGGGKIVMFSNPTRTSGTFYDAFHSKREFWHTLHISSEETPNARTGQAIVPGLAGRDWIEEKRREWGEGSPLFDVRVRGHFPSQAENAVIGLTLVTDAIERWPETPADGPLVLGVDVARFGDDDTVIQPVRGRKALEPIILHSVDTRAVTEHVLGAVVRLRQPNEKVRLQVDEIGIGAGVTDTLKGRDQANNTVTVGINVARRATSQNEALLRDQLWFAVADWLRGGGAIPPDARLEAELVAPTYGFTPEGRRKVESKTDIKQRLGRSPDRADALALAVYQAPVIEKWEPIRVPSRSAGFFGVRRR